MGWKKAAGTGQTWVDDEVMEPGADVAEGVGELCQKPSQRSQLVWEVRLSDSEYRHLGRALALLHPI